jgi:hypothetical protein
MDFLMSEENDHSSDIFGLLEGSPRSILKLSDHIQRYTKTTLSYQTDVINAMRGLFASFAQATPPVRHYWGIPTSATAYSRVRAEEHDHDSEYASYIGIMCHGLLWVAVSTRSMTRRQDFPSWSWVGWVGPVRWTQLDRSNDPDTPVSISVVNHEGSLESLSAKSCGHALQHGVRDSSICTYLLHISAEIISVRFVCPHKYYLIRGMSRSGNRMSHYRYIATSCDGASHTGFGWIFDCTPFFDKDDDLHRVLCEEQLDCVVLSREYGIVVHQRQKPTERIERVGRIELYSRFDIQGKRWKTPNTTREQRPHLRDHFPSTRRKIVLG